MTTVSQMQTAVDKSLVNMDRLDNIVNGGPTVTVTTDGGPVKSIAKWQADLEAEVEAGLGTATVDTIVGLRDALKVTSQIPSTPRTIDINTLGSRRADVRDWDGMDLTGANDCTSLIWNGIAQSTVAGVPLEIPAGTITMTAGAEIPAGCIIQGTSGTYDANNRRGRTMFNLAHTGVGFSVTGAAGGRVIRNISTRRQQPTITSSAWTPTNHGFDFYVDGATDVEFEDILLVNATRGIVCTNGGGRFTFNKIWGQPLLTGIQIDTSYDTTRIRDVHFWNFWSAGNANEDRVLEHMLANGTAIYSKRNDNPELNAIFAIFYRHGLRIGNWAGGLPGTTKRMRGFGLGFDACGSGLTLDADANGATIELHGFYAHGHDTIMTNASLIEVNGTNSTVRVYGKTDMSNAHRSAIRNVGAGSHVSAQDIIVDGFNKEGIVGAPAIAVDPSAYGVTLTGDYTFGGAVGGAAVLGGAGKVYGIWRDYTPVITAGTGSFGAAPTVNWARYKIENGRCQVEVSITVGSNGTAAQDIRITTPFATDSIGSHIGNAKNSTNARALTAQLFSGTNTVAIASYDGSYPITGGSGTIVFEIDYRLP